MKRRGLYFANVVLATFLWALAGAQAQETITNVSQFSSAFDQPGLSYPLVFPYEPTTFQPMDTWFVDFTALANTVGAVTNYPGQTENGITVWPLRLIQAADTGEVVLKYAWINDVELLRIAAPTNYVAFATYGETLQVWAILSAFFFGEGHTSYDALIADGLTFLDPPRVVMDVWAVAAADKEAYSTNGVTVAAEDEGSGPGRMMLMGMMLMGADPCTIANDSDPFFITSIAPDGDGNMVIEWQSCSDHQYEVQAAPALSTTQTMPPFLWSTLATTCGNDGTTSYTDGDSWLYDQRFYRVQRLASTPPTIFCPADVTLECGQSTDPSSTGMATASHPCHADPTVTFTDAISGSCPQIITRTWQATDASSNSATCVQIITVTDTTPPTISCPPDKQLQCGDSTDPADTGMATATDNCDTNVTVSYTDATTPANCTGKPGIDRTWKATDACGNVATCVQHITFVDTTPPTITASPTGGNLGCNPATLPDDASVKALVTATDNCGTPTVNVSHVDANSGCVVTRTFTVTATDGCGNTSAAQTVVDSWTADTTPPTVTVPVGSNLGCNPATLPDDANVKALVTATDNCGVPTVNVSHVDANSGCVVTRTFTVTATDGCGNTSAAQTVVDTWTVDTTAPTVTVPAGSNLGCNPATLPDDASVKALVTATDNCSVPTVNVSHVDASSGCAVTRTFTVTATDGCGNASAGQTVVYTWTADTTPPTITCPTAIIVSSLPAPNPSSVTASDNCAGTVTKSFVSDSVVTNGCQIVVTRTYRATDACGNSATCTQTITVAPLISPTDCILWHAPLANSPANDDTDPSRINGQVSGTKYKYAFKAGSTIPIQVRVNGCATADVTTNPNVVAEVNVYADQNCDNLPDGNELLIDYNGVGEAGGVMDTVGGFKKYNLNTKTLTTPGCYVVEVVVTDSSTGQSCKERVLLQRR